MRNEESIKAVLAGASALLLVIGMNLLELWFFHVTGKGVVVADCVTFGAAGVYAFAIAKYKR